MGAAIPPVAAIALPPSSLSSSSSLSEVEEEEEQGGGARAGRKDSEKNHPEEVSGPLPAPLFQPLELLPLTFPWKGLFGEDDW